MISASIKEFSEKCTRKYVCGEKCSNFKDGDAKYITGDKVCNFRTRGSVQIFDLKL